MAACLKAKKAGMNFITGINTLFKKSTHLLMIDLAGHKRVVISNVKPCVENGMYPSKTILNESLIISADIFTDGHDEISACVLIKYKESKQWKEVPLKCTDGNDCWELSFTPSKAGIYQFQLMGWVDHYATWRKGLIEKYNAGQEIKVELAIGLEIATAAMARADAKDKKKIQEWINSVKEAEDPHAAMKIVADDKISELLHRCRDKKTITATAQIYEVEVERKRAEFSAWYELFPRSASPVPGEHGTFKDVKHLLPQIAQMGFDVLYFPPIHPIGERNRKGKNNALEASPDDPGSPWAIGNISGGHKAINPLLGTLDDFKGLIKECKRLGIEIAMDIAYQCSPDHPYVSQHPQWFKWRPDGTVQYAENPPKKYEDIIPFNFECEDREALWEELKSIVEYWIDAGISIFRVDNPHTKPFAFWEWMIKEVKKKNGDVLFLAEAFTRPRIMEWLAKAGFTQSYTYFTWRHTKRELEEYITELTKTDQRFYFRPNLWPNTPDILTAELSNGRENGHIMRLIMAATMSSNYGLYGPVYELGDYDQMPGKEEYADNEKYEIKTWDWQRMTKTKEIIIRINKIRKDNPALQTTTNIEFCETTNDNIICYLKTDLKANNIIIVAVNLDPFQTHAANVKVPLYKSGVNLQAPYMVRDLLSGDKHWWTNDWNYVELNPYDLPAHVFRIEQN
jgi:starch synthase (maltosyl-transferring)